MEFSFQGTIAWNGVLPDLTLDGVRPLYQAMGLRFDGADDVRCFFREVVGEFLPTVKEKRRHFPRAMYSRAWQELDGRLGEATAAKFRLWFREIAVGMSSLVDADAADNDWDLYSDAIFDILIQMSRGHKDDTGIGARLRQIEPAVQDWREMPDVLQEIRKVVDAGRSEWDEAMYRAMRYKPGPYCLAGFFDQIDCYDPLDTAYDMAKRNRLQIMWEKLLEVITPAEAEALRLHAKKMAAKYVNLRAAEPKSPFLQRRKLTWK